MSNFIEDMILNDLHQKGAAGFIVGGQWGSESKGSAASWLAWHLSRRGRCYDIVTTNAGAQAGHTSIHKGVRRVSFHMPTAPWIFQDEGDTPIVYLNAGSIIDPDIALKEFEGYKGDIFIHPNAAVITQECKDAEGQRDSAQTKIASTRKGVGEALSRKTLRSGVVAKGCKALSGFVRRLDLNHHLRTQSTVLVEVPQGVSLSLNHSQFYPFCTSRDCSPADAAANAGIHPSFYGGNLVVLRTYPIRVGNIVEGSDTLGTSGTHFPDQRETSWEELGVTAEITTVTKRVRRVFTFSVQQLRETFALCRPDAVMLTFCNYCKTPDYLDNIVSAIYQVSKETYLPTPRILYEYGPTTEEISTEYDMGAGIGISGERTAAGLTTAWGLPLFDARPGSA